MFNCTFHELPALFLLKDTPPPIDPSGLESNGLFQVP